MRRWWGSIWGSGWGSGWGCSWARLSHHTVLITTLALLHHCSWARLSHHTVLITTLALLHHTTLKRKKSSIHFISLKSWFKKRRVARVPKEEVREELLGLVAMIYIAR